MVICIFVDSLSRGFVSQNKEWCVSTCFKFGKIEIMSRSL